LIPGQQTLIERELTASEQLLWTGAPRQGLRLRPADAFMIPFSLLWGGFAMFWEYSVLRGFQGQDSHSPPLFFALWGVPFVLMGLYLIVGRFFVDAFQRARTVYAVTNKRALIVTTWWNRQVNSVSLQPLPAISLTEKSDGSGTITFGPQLPYNHMLVRGWPGASKQTAPAFEFVEHVRNVYDFITATTNR